MSEDLQALRWASTGRLFGGAFKIFNDRVVAGIVERGHPGIGITQSAVIRSMNVGGTTISELAQRAGVTRQAMAQLVRDLVDHGYVRLEPHPSDRRAKLVRYTERGEELATDAFAAVQDVEADMVRRMGERKMKRLRELLTELVDDTPEMRAARASWFRGY